MTTSTSDAPLLDRGDVWEFIQGLFRSITAVDGYTAQLRRAFHMNAHERLAIAALWAEGPMTMTQLGAWIPLSRAAVTTLVDRLEAGGFVSRRADPGDRRRTVVEVSREALDAMIPVMRPWTEDVHAFATEFDDEDWRVVERFITGLRDLSIDHSTRLKQFDDDEIRARAARTT